MANSAPWWSDIKRCKSNIGGLNLATFTGRDLIKMHLCAVVWVGGNRSDIRSPIATNPFFLLLFVSLSGLVMLTHDRTNKNLGLLKVNCSSIHLCFPPPSLHPAAVKDKINAILFIFFWYFIQKWYFVTWILLTHCEKK